MNRPQEIIKHIAETIYGHMDVAYDKGFEAGTKTMQECSWEKGVTDAWDCVVHTLNMLGKDEDIKADERAVMRAIAHTFETSDAIGFTRSYVEMKNLTADDEADEPIEVGDVVLDPSGNECVITNDDTHYHVIYTSNGKTYKWNKDTKFKPIGKRRVIPRAR